MRIERELSPKVEGALRKFPVVALMGPRQSGKTTLCRNLLPGYRYINLEDISHNFLPSPSGRGRGWGYGARTIFLISMACPCGLMRCR